MARCVWTGWQHSSGLGGRNPWNTQQGTRDNLGIQNGDTMLFLYRMSDQSRTKYRSRKPQNPLRLSRFKLAGPPTPRDTEASNAYAVIHDSLGPVCICSLIGINSDYQEIGKFRLGIEPRPPVQVLVPFRPLPHRGQTRHQVCQGERMLRMGRV